MPEFKAEEIVRISVFASQSTANLLRLMDIGGNIEKDTVSLPQ